MSSTYARTARAVMKSRAASLWNAVGNTPMLEIECRFRGRERTVFAKLESENLTGSIKDRMALAILERALARGELGPNWTIAEASSGNTGISFASIGRALGLEVRIFMPDWMSAERKKIIESLGATIELVSAADGGFIGCIERADRFAKEHERVFRPQQFSNVENALAHRQTTGVEIVEQLDELRAEPCAFVAGVGTGGTLVGVGECLRERFPGIGVHPLEPANSPTLRTGKKRGSHRIQGISDDFIPDLVVPARWDAIVDVWDGDAILAAQRLSRELGLAVGISSGANLLGALFVAHERDAGPVVTVFADSNKKYLSTDLLRREPLLEHYASRDLQLGSFRVLPRG